jgi:hypothetical protein
MQIRLALTVTSAVARADQVEVKMRGHFEHAKVFGGLIWAAHKQAGSFGKRRVGQLTRLQR